MKKNLVKSTAVLLILAMIITLFAGLTLAQADALIDQNAKGSITVYKYASLTNPPPTLEGAGSGQSGQTAPAGNVPVADVEFSVYVLADTAATMAYYNGTNDTTYSVSDLSDDAVAYATGTTDSTGKCTISNLPVGIYVLKETKTPEQITTPLMDPCLVSIPMVNSTTSVTADTDWIYDIHVYPKNHESRGNVELTKTGLNGVALEGVTFELKKKVVTDGVESWADVVAYNDDGTPITYTLSTNAEGKLTIKDLPSGLEGTQYRLVETSSLPGYIVNHTPMLFTVTKNNTVTWDSGDANTAVTTHTVDGNTLTLKLENLQPDLTKEVKLANGTWGNDANFEIDQTLNYRITITVPTNVAELATFKVTDVPSVGIKDVVNDTKYPTIDGLGKGTDYTVSETTDGGFELVFTSAGKTAIADKGTIVINYTAVMTEDAVVNGDGNKNNATLTYSSEVGATSPDEATIEDETRVFTYSHNITKILEDKDGNQSAAPAGIEFELYHPNTTTAMSVCELAAGKYRLALPGDDASKVGTTLKTGDDGKIEIQGLTDGSYSLKEIKTVDGYNLLSSLYTFTVASGRATTWTTVGTFTDGEKIVKTYKETTYSAAYNTTDISKIINKEGFVLPQTGSMGYLLFCAAGLMLVFVGARIIMSDRKRRVR